jgi:7-keto-8-aminopelargonate synthetase-like enzyme
LHFVDARQVQVGRRRLLYFSGSDYLGLGRHPRVLRAMRRCLDAGWTHPGASRATTGDHPVYLDAERALARYFRQPAAALVPCGYVAPLAAVQALRPRATHVLLDDAAHACMKDAAALSGLPLRAFPHGGLRVLGAAVRSLGRQARPLLLTDGVFGTRGGLAPLADYLAALPRRGWMLVDDAHGAGTAGPGGRGAAAHYGIEDERVLLAISLAKAFGVSGGAVLGPAPILEELRSRAAAYVGTTSIPLAVAAGIRAAASVLRSEPERVRRLQESARRLHELLPRHPAVSNHPLTPVTAIVPESAAQAGCVCDALLAAGIFPPFIRYLSGPASGFFRLALNTVHTVRDIERLAQAVRRGLGVS